MLVRKLLANRFDVMLDAANQPGINIYVLSPDWSLRTLPCSDEALPGPQTVNNRNDFLGLEITGLVLDMALFDMLAKKVQFKSVP